MEREVEIWIGDDSMTVTIDVPARWCESEDSQTEYLVNYIFENIEIYPRQKGAGA